MSESRFKVKTSLMNEKYVKRTSEKIKIFTHSHEPVFVTSKDVTT